MNVAMVSFTSIRLVALCYPTVEVQCKGGGSLSRGIKGFFMLPIARCQCLPAETTRNFSARKDTIGHPKMRQWHGASKTNNKKII